MNDKVFWKRLQIWEWDWELIIIVIGIVALSFIASRIIRFFLHRYFLSESRYLNNDVTNYRFFSNAVSFIVFLVTVFTIIYIIPPLRSLSVTLLASAGIFAAILGFASQAAFANIIGGIFIVIFKPYRVGDRIEVGNANMGEVEDITLRHTIIRDFKNNRIIIPNSTMSSETIINSNIGDERNCRYFEIGISYDADINKAIDIIRDEAIQHEYCLDPRTEEQKKKGAEAVEVKVVGYGDSSINLRAYVWAKDPIHGWELFTSLNKSVKERFDKEGVEIPFPYRTIVYKNDITPNPTDGN